MVMTIDVSVATQSYNVSDCTYVTPGIPYCYDGSKLTGDNARTETLLVYVDIFDDGTPTNGYCRLEIEPYNTPGMDMTSMEGSYLEPYSTATFGGESCVSYNILERAVGQLLYGFMDADFDDKVLAENPGFTADNDYDLSYKITAYITDSECVDSGVSSSITFTLHTMYGDRADTIARVQVFRSDTVGRILVSNDTLGIVGGTVQEDMTVTLPRRRGGEYPYFIPGDFVAVAINIWGQTMDLTAAENELEWTVWTVGIEVADYTISAPEAQTTRISFRKDVDPDAYFHFGVLGAGSADKNDPHGTPFGHVSWRANGGDDTKPLIYFDRPANIPLGSSYHKSKSVQKGKHHAKRV